MRATDPRTSEPRARIKPQPRSRPLARSYKSLIFLCNEVIALCAVVQSAPIRPNSARAYAPPVEPTGTPAASSARPIGSSCFS
jgi:hypothetical protein